MTALRASSALRCESMKSTSTLRPASLPWPLMYFAKACTPLTMPWNRPGRAGLSTSAITAILIVSAVTPISLSGEPPGWFCRGSAPAAAGSTAQPIPTATATNAHRLRFTVPPSARFPPPRGSPGAGQCVPKRNVFQDARRPSTLPAMASPVAERAPAGAIDLLDGDLYAGDPDPTYAWLRRHAPVYRDELNSLWGVSRYDDIVAIEKDPPTFCSSEGYRPNLPADDSMIGNDDPRHNERRRLVARRFTPKAVAAHEAEVRALARGLVEAVLDRGRCEVVEKLAAPLPAMVIGRLLGFDHDQWSRVKYWSETTILAGGGPRYTADSVTEAFEDYCE